MQVNNLTHTASVNDFDNKQKERKRKKKGGGNGTGEEAGFLKACMESMRKRTESGCIPSGRLQVRHIARFDGARDLRNAVTVGFAVISHIIVIIFDTVGHPPPLPVCGIRGIHSLSIFFLPSLFFYFSFPLFMLLTFYNIINIQIHLIMQVNLHFLKKVL